MTHGDNYVDLLRARVPALIAQLVEHQAASSRALGSMPGLSTETFFTKEVFT